MGAMCTLHYLLIFFLEGMQHMQAHFEFLTAMIKIHKMLSGLNLALF